MNKLIRCCVVLSTLLIFCDGARILGLVLIPSRSHAILVERLLLELAQRGHDVSMVTPFPGRPNTTRNFTYISIAEVSQILSSQNLYERNQNSAVADIAVLMGFGLKFTEAFLMHPEFEELKTASKFDLIITEAFLSEAVFAGFSATHAAPVVAFGTFMPAPWVNFMVGNPSPWSYIPDPLLGYGTHMNFWQRATNTVFSIMVEMSHRLYFIPKQDELMRRYFRKDLPPLEDIVKNVSLVLVNHHYSLAYPRPYTANMIEVGGLHIDPPKPLPQDIKEFLDGASHGAIFFSLGSNLKSSEMPKEKLQAFIRAFSKIKQRVLWKFEEELPGVPENVKILKWLPQGDVLAHPNVKAFMTHGGLLSTTEAVHRGVPIIGIPIFGDQPMNMRAVENAGLGVTLSFSDISEDLLIRAINKVTGNPQYQNAAQQRSALLKDTPLSALDRAVYWVEYVLRHEGAPHLKSRAQNLRWFELYMLDTMGILLTMLCSTALILRGLFKLISRCVRGVLLKGIAQNNIPNKKDN